MTIDGSNSSASIATSGLRIKDPSHGATAKANDVPRGARKMRSWIKASRRERRNPLTADEKGYARRKEWLGATLVSSKQSMKVTTPTRDRRW